jgi:small acid-soluble spore protein O (minor)
MNIFSPSMTHPINGGEYLMAKRKANHVIPGANAASAQGVGAGYNEEFSNEPLTAEQRQNNKKRKKNQ